jgi:hypothetical protein
VRSAAATATAGLYELQVVADLEDGNGEQTLPYGWDQNVRDPHGIYPQVDAYLTANPNIIANATPYVEPAPSTNPDDYPLQPYQFQAMLRIAGVYDQVNTAVAAISDPTQRAVAQAKLAVSTFYARNDPLVSQLGALVNLTPAQIDTYWMQAKDL